mgnify:CR=1 FL=1
MKNFFRQNGLLLALIALLLSILIGVGSALLGGNTDPLSNVVNTVASPIRGGVSAVMDWAEGVYTYVFHYQELHDQLSDLQVKVSQLEEQVRQGEEASRENEQLRQLLQIDQRRLTPAEEKYLVSWIRMGFRDDTIRMAYERTCLNTGALKWAYMNSILTSWHEQNLHTPEEILAGDAPRKPEQRRASAYQQHDAALSPLAQEAVARMLAEEDD